MKSKAKMTIMMAFALPVLFVLSACTLFAPTNNVPGEVENFVATAGDGQVLLTWDAPLDNGGSAILEFQITMGAWVNAISVPAHTRAFTFTELTNGSTYSFSIRAVSSVGNGGAVTISVTLELE